MEDNHKGSIFSDFAVKFFCVKVEKQLELFSNFFSKINLLNLGKNRDHGDRLSSVRQPQRIVPSATRYLSHPTVFSNDNNRLYSGGWRLSARCHHVFFNDCTTKTLRFSMQLQRLPATTTGAAYTFEREATCKPTTHSFCQMTG